MKIVRLLVLLTVCHITIKQTIEKKNTRKTQTTTHEHMNKHKIKYREDNENICIIWRYFKSVPIFKALESNSCVLYH